MQEKKYIKVIGARENNLKNVNVVIPKETLTVFTGVSGSGKSTLAFDTIYSEGQRRYVESLSPYARQFLGGVSKPDVESIEGLSPAISIDQKSTSHNPRSTVGTVTEIYDFLRLLFARIGVPYCPTHNIPIVSFSVTSMADIVENYEEGSKIQILAPIIRSEKGTHKDVIAKLIESGFVRARIDGEFVSLDEVKPLNKNERHNIDLVIDRLIIREKSDNRSRIYEDIEIALDYGHGEMIVYSSELGDKLLTNHHTCPKCGFSVPKLEPRLFSFNAPLGYCPSCNGLGLHRRVEEDLMVQDENLSMNEGCLGYYKNIALSSNIEWLEVEYLCNHYKIPLDKPWKSLTRKQKDIILYGTDEDLTHKIKTVNGNVINKRGPIEGVATKINRLYSSTNSEFMKRYYKSFMRDSECDVCHGARLNKEALSVKVNGLNIYEATCLSIEKFSDWVNGINDNLSEIERKIVRLLIQEIKSRTKFLLDVGLSYLTLSRLSMTLSGGEAQRIRLATQIGSSLSGVIYVLDEPSIGLHERDNARLIKTMKEMRDLGNTLIVVEHDEETMRNADYIVDIGPTAGVKGGKVVACGSIDDIMNEPTSITGQYLSGKKYVEVPKDRRKGNGKNIKLKGCSSHNLKNVDVGFPLGKFIAVTGVSGSGKSTLINETLGKVLRKELNKADVVPGKYKSITGIKNIDKFINITQEPIGRTPRSNCATYTSVFDDIRALFAETPTARAKGYDKGRFSFNIPGGRCEKCSGAGVILVPMNFLPDVYVKCDECDGHRYNEETLSCTYKGKSIFDVLDMRVEEAIEFFRNRPKIKRTLQTLMDVGLGYLKLGQPATTLSGGETQRIKLAKELQKRSTGKTLYILDEPTTGLHVDDVKRLIKVLNELVDLGNTVIVIEHNMDVIKVADHIIDLGPEGGDLGGTIIATGTPEEITKHKNSYTGQYLKKYI